MLEALLTIKPVKIINAAIMRFAVEISIPRPEAKEVKSSKAISSHLRNY